jgi:hypothetical protein
MGLDISVIAQLEPAPKDLSDEDLETMDLYHLYNPGIKRDGSVKEGYYSGERVFHFRAGSYSGYGEFRRQLCRKMLGVDPEVVLKNERSYQGKPFFELISFSDCEGFIGTDICAKLAKDFEEHRGKLPAADDEEYARLLQDYESWTEAFKKAVWHNGVVRFS